MEHQSQESKSLSLILFVAGAAVLALTAIALLSNLGSTISKNSVDSSAENAYRQQAMVKVLSPIGSVKSVDKSLAPATRTGEQVYTAVCAACHSSGLLDAPKFANEADWAPRVTALGLDGLVTSAIAGKGSMPARGGVPTVTDEEVRNAILHMTKDTGLDLEKASGEASEAVVDTDPSMDVAQVASAPIESDIEGIAIYAKNCFVCHDTGVLGSQKLGDKAAWSASIAKGTDTLYASAINGIAAMPARGGNPSLNDDEIKAAVDYMISVS